MNSTAKYSLAAEYVKTKMNIPVKRCVTSFFVQKYLKASIKYKEAQIRLKMTTPHEVYKKGSRETRQKLISMQMDSVMHKNDRIVSFDDFLGEMFLESQTPKDMSKNTHELRSHVELLKELKKEFLQQKDTNPDMISGLNTNLKKQIKQIANNKKSRFTISKDVVSLSSRLTKSKLKKMPNYNYDKHKSTWKEPILNLATNKASIANIDREDWRSDRTKTHESFLNQYNNGLKTIKDVLTKHLNEDLDIFVDMVNKIQHGAGRHFWVATWLTRLLVYIVEAEMKHYCNLLKEEFITKSADKRLEYLQMDSDRLRRIQQQNILKWASINGDRTKWAPSAMMNEYLYYFKNWVDISNPINVLIRDVIFKIWHTKRAIIPESVKSTFLDNNLTPYPEAIELPMSFLMGFFNYASSLKHVSEIDLSIQVFKEIKKRHLNGKLTIASKEYNLNPNRLFETSFRVHSDDYNIEIVYADEVDLLMFRVVEQIIGKCCNIKDSEKKTNIHTYISEFVTLFNIAGDVIYPYEKLTAVTALDLPYKGWSDDYKAALSSVANIFRNGAPAVTAYFVQKWVNYMMSDLYSLRTGQTNDLDELLKLNRYVIPIELGGLSDVLPIVLYFDLNGANYRAIKYGIQKLTDQEDRNKARALFTSIDRNTTMASWSDSQIFTRGIHFRYGQHVNGFKI
jgi:hypothetical protein